MPKQKLWGYNSILGKLTFEVQNLCSANEQLLYNMTVGHANTGRNILKHSCSKLAWEQFELFPVSPSGS